MTDTYTIHHTCIPQIYLTHHTHIPQIHMSYTIHVYHRYTCIQKWKTNKIFREVCGLLIIKVKMGGIVVGGMEGDGGFCNDPPKVGTRMERMYRHQSVVLIQ